MTFTGMRVKWLVILADRFGPEILIMLEIKGQVKLTRKLLRYVLSRLNEISVDRGNLCLVSQSLPPTT